MFPSWLLENNTRLNRLLLRDTSLTGPLNLPQHPAPNLLTIDMSDNNIHDQISRNTCMVFPHLKNFLMANTNSTGCLPPCFENMSSLAYLDLSNNHMSCAKLEHLPTVGSSLWFLKLSNNDFRGQIPHSIFNVSYYPDYLFLDGNNFVGHVSGNPSNELSFEVVDISNNHLSGKLPRLNVFSAINLSTNHFEGPIPAELCKGESLAYLDLSENNLSGSLPFFDAPQLCYVQLHGNQLSGPLTNAFYNSSSLVTLDLGDNNLTGSIPNWIDRLSELSILLLRGNHFDGELPVQLCWLKKLSILDLSQNNFSGRLSSCLSNLNFKESDAKLEVFFGGFSRDDEGNIGLPPPGSFDSKQLWPKMSLETVVKFTMKRNCYTYNGKILRFMSAIDLSCNRFSGEIPTEWGNLMGISALNLSRNNLTGAIPPSFSNLKQIESLDLSYNNLNGRIPPQLTELNFLEVFNVSYNNLSGRTPEMKNQFGTFDESSYIGNPLLSGPPLQNNGSQTESPSETVPVDSDEDDGFIDMESFYVSFVVCYIIVVLTIAAVLRINQHWRRRWFYFIEECIDNCYCFVVINFRKLSNFRRA